MALPVPASSFLLLIAIGLIILDPMAHAGETDASSPTPFASHENSSVMDLSTELQRVKAQLIDLEENLAIKDLALQEKQENIISLEGELGTHKNDGGGDIAAAFDHAQGRLKVLESKFFQLESELHTKVSELVELKHRVKVLEAAEAERNMKGQQLEKLIVEQKSLVEKVEHTLHAAEATLVRVQKEADARNQEFLKAHRGWFPVWASYRLLQIQGSMADYCAKHAQHYWDTAFEKVSVVKSLVHKWSRHHSYSVNAAHQQTWVRVLKHLLSSLNPHVEEAQSRATGAYEAIEEFCTQQLETIRSVLEPHVQVAKETGRPYIEAVAGYARPKIEQVQAVIRPYFEKALYNYKNFLTLITNYHSQLQTSVMGRLKKVDFLDSMARQGCVWFLAYMLLILPIFGIFIIIFPIFRSNKPMKPMKSHHHGHGHKKTKRVKQADK